MKTRKGIHKHMDPFLSQKSMRCGSALMEIDGAQYIPRTFLHPGVFHVCIFHIQSGDAQVWAQYSDRASWVCIKY